MPMLGDSWTRSALFDGAIGTELYNRGLFINRNYEEANLVSPGLVSDIHRDYRNAGAEILTTNSWGASRPRLKQFGLEERVHEINQQAARLAKDVAGKTLKVAGSIGPLGIHIEAIGSMSFGDARSDFRGQAGALVEGGVDCIILETFTQVEEVEAAVLAIRDIDTSLPIFACVAVDEEGLLPGCPSLEVAIDRIISTGVDVMGFNCHLGPLQMLEIVKKFKHRISVPIIVEPNAGLPRDVDGRMMYMSNPEYFATFAKRFLEEGVRFVGGCCGTTPRHTKAMSQAMRHHRALSHGSTIELVARVDSPAIEEKPRLPFAEKSRWSSKLAKGEKVFTIELLPPLGSDPAKLLAGAHKALDAGLDAVNLPDGPRASSRMSALVSAVLVEQKVGIETIMHYACRDRNLIGMQADLLGMQAIGLRNVLLVTGDPPKLGDYPDATGVFDIDSIGLVKMAQRLNGGFDIGGKPLSSASSLSLGVGVNPLASDFEQEMRRFEKKVEAGAEWAITQPVFHVPALVRFLERLERQKTGIPIIIGIWPLTSLRNAQFMATEVPGVEIPEEIMKRFEGAMSPEAARDISVAIAAEMYRSVLDRVQGVQLSAPFGRVDLALRVIGR
ncbi:MAG: bifunctional homocysteine S-methyltransferase/methylenetetrahydrofolate reductase [Rectinemataceae bacterium]